MIKPFKNNPYEEGSIKRFIDLFVRPLMKYKPQHLYITDYLETELFHTDTRTIRRYVASKPFEMSGYWMMAPTIGVPPLTRIKNVLEGDEVWVSLDSETQLALVQVIGKTKNVVFKMSIMNFTKKVVPNLRIKPFRHDMRKKRRSWEDPKVEK